MMSNFDWPHLKITPRVYWYFGLTFQYYVLYLVMHKYFSNMILLVLSLLSLFFFYLLGLGEFENVMIIFRACFIGWMSLFALGIYMAKEYKVINVNKFSLWVNVILLLILSAVVVLLNLYYVLWIFLPLVALLWFITLSVIIIQTKRLALCFRWIGMYSAFVFVCHPIARQICFTLNLTSLSIWYQIIIYIIMTVSLAYLYRKVFWEMQSKIAI